MKITVEIECTDTNEALNHLTNIRKKVRNFLVKSDQGSDDDVAHYSHNNCDGYWTADIDLT